MVNHQVEDHRYEFTICLCLAIQMYTQNEEANNPFTFYYRGANLKYAVERTLYFRYVNSDDFYNEFLKAYKENINNDASQDLYIFLKETIHRRFSENLIEYLFEIIRQVKWFVQNSVTRIIFFWTKKNSLKKNRIAFYVPNAKFFNYLKPILENVNEEVALFSGFRNVMGEPVSTTHPDFSVVAPLCGGGVLDKLPKGLIEFKILAQYYDSYEVAFKKYSVNKVVLAEGNSPEHEVMNQLGKRNNIPVICLQHGWSPITHVGFQNMTYHSMLMWGNGFGELLNDYNKNQKFIVVGNHKSDGLDKPGFENVNSRSSIAFFLQGNSESTGGLLTQSIVKSFFNLILWTAENFKDADILVREHPNAPLSLQENEMLSKWPNIKLVPADKLSLRSIFSKCHLSISMYSSVILESIANGVIPIIVNLTSMPKYIPDVSKAGAGIEVRDIENAKIQIEGILKNESVLSHYQNALENFRKEYFSFHAEVALQKIVEQICH